MLTNGKTSSVIEKFKSIDNKKDCIFVKFDIREFYPSISESIFKKSILFAKEHHHIPDEDVRIIDHCRKSLLFHENEPWKKKKTESYFDVTMRSYDEAEICELVGIYILTRLATIIKKSDCGLYRDDGLVILRNEIGQQIDCTRKNIIKIFKDVGFGIDIETNSKVVDFLDITFNLNNGIYKPYKKPNDRLLYINKSSNHPPQIINQLPKIISDRLSRNSSNKEVFNTAKGEYEEALKRSGYSNISLSVHQSSISHVK